MAVPPMRSMLSVPVQTNNFVPVQSAQLAVSNAGASGSQDVTFTILPGSVGGRITYKITNSGEEGAYIAAGIGSATAIVATATPSPAAGAGVSISNCDYIAGGAILTQDYPAQYDTLAAICSGSNTTTLEITIGYGQ